MATMKDQVELWCEPCGAEFSEFLKRPENVIPDEDIPDDEAAMEQSHQRLTSVMAAADAYVREQAAHRKAGR